MNANKPFDHDRHCRLLEDAERELSGMGKHDLAAAVSSARSIHIDFQGRIATAKREVGRMRKVAEKAEEVARTMEQYVTRPDAPWIGVDLFPKGEE